MWLLVLYKRVYYMYTYICNRYIELKTRLFLSLNECYSRPSANHNFHMDRFIALNSTLNLAMKEE